MEKLKEKNITKGESASDFFLRIMANQENLRRALEVTDANVDELKRISELLEDVKNKRAEIKEEFDANGNRTVFKIFKTRPDGSEEVLLYMDDVAFDKVISEYQALEFLFQDGVGWVLDKPIPSVKDN